LKLLFKEKSVLYNKHLNVRLGYAYLSQNLTDYKGCPILTLASYNAGPKPANEWLNLFGDPRSPQTHRLNWIELIPYGETRNYIQRVIEAKRVYEVKIKKRFQKKVKAN
jgi:soluble lytic murein transglycosylase